MRNKDKNSTWIQKNCLNNNWLKFQVSIMYVGDTAQMVERSLSMRSQIYSFLISSSFFTIFNIVNLSVQLVLKKFENYLFCYQNFK